MTHSFQIPESGTTDGEFEEDIAQQYCLDYLKYIRDKGCDHLQVGWYTSSIHSEMFSKFFLSTLLHYQVFQGIPFNRNFSKSRRNKVFEENNTVCLIGNGDRKSANRKQWGYLIPSNRKQRFTEVSIFFMGEFLGKNDGC